MDQPKLHLKEAFEDISLTPAEKAAMWGHISAAIARRPRAARPQSSPYFWYTPRPFVGVLGALLLIVLVGGGTAYAAQGALPGDLLYPIKVGVTEPVEVALASTPAQKAQVEATIAERRLQEAQALAVQGRLTATTTAQLQENFDTHAAAAAAIAQSIAPQDPADAAQISTQLDSSVAANGDVLASIGRESKDDMTRKNTSVLATTALSLASSTVAVPTIGVIGTSTPTSSLRTLGIFRFHSSTSTAGTSTAASSVPPSISATSSEENAQMEGIAGKLEALATADLESAQASLSSIQGSLDATTTAEIQTRLSNINALLSQGSAALGQNSYDSAAKDFKSALEEAIQLQTFLSAGQEVSPNLLPDLLHERLQMGSERGDARRGVLE